jgi:hypothetical protein
MSEEAVYVSPVIMERVKRPIDGDPEKCDYDMLEITRADDGQLLATCMMSDDMGVERIADRLSAMKLWREANRLRAMVMESRRPAKGKTV